MAGQSSKPGLTRFRRVLLLCLALLAPALLVLAIWTGWAERHPQQERQLRVDLQQQLQEQFPAAMQPAAGRYGIYPQTADALQPRALGVVLVHGLDEPGGIWADLLPALAEAGYQSWEFRYPNDQGIDRSVDLLAASWQALPDERPVALIGHSMGGLVVRDFVTRWRHPANGAARVSGATVPGVILAGTPNQGSDWARLRVLLELRDQWAAGQQSGFSPLAGLQDGTGAAKIDLQPGSDFLVDLNGRSWPESVQMHIIGGIVLSSAPGLGDGVVAVDSLSVAGAPPPVMVEATHRGMLARLFESEAQPPAIPVIISLLGELERGL